MTEKWLENICEFHFERKFYINQWIEVRTQRPNVERYNGAIGQIVRITNRDIVYCTIGRYTPCFHFYELHPIPAPVGDAA